MQCVGRSNVLRPLQPRRLPDCGSSCLDNPPMNDLIAFFAGWLIAAILLMPQAHARINVSPTVPNYSAASGAYRAPAGAFTMAPANAGYIQPAVANVGGKPITVPAKMRMAANAGQYVKGALKLNPWAIAGTVAAGWLLDEGLEWANDHWAYRDPAVAPEHLICNGNAGSNMSESAIRSATEANCASWLPNVSWQTPGPINPPIGGVSWKYAAPNGQYCQHYTCGPETADNSRPATDDDWAALPDPLPALAPELPYAPYMPDGAPVEAPGYDFAPFNIPLGSPYTKPDGSTAQPMASVSPNGDSITVDTYDQPLTDANGDPVPNPQPQDTPEPAPEQKTDCDKYPNSLGCSELGAVEDVPVPTETRSIADISPVSVGGAGSCPAPLTTSFMGRPVSFSYDMPCSFATSLKPLILAIAWLSSGLIFIGGVRQ